MSVVLFLWLSAAPHHSLALKLPSFLSSWRPTTTAPLAQSPVGHQSAAQDPLMSSASVFEPDARPAPSKFAAPTRTHQHHLPLHLLRSLPKSIFGRFLPAAQPTTSTTAASLVDSSAHMLVDWSALVQSGANANDNMQAPQFMVSQQPQPQPPPSSFGNVRHFQASQPQFQADHFTGIDPQQQQQQQPAELKKHALGFGDSGEDFATIMTVEPAAQQQQPDSQPEPNHSQASDEAPSPSSSQQGKDNNNSSSSSVQMPNSSANNSSEDSSQLGADSKLIGQQPTNRSNSSSPNSSPLSNLIGDELTRLRQQQPDELNSMGEPLLALLMENQPNNSSSARQPVDGEQQPAESGPESGRSESAASAVVVAGPPSPPPPPPPNDQELRASGAGADNHEFESVADEDSAILDGEQMENFILGPFKGLTSDGLVHHNQRQPQVFERIQRQPSAGVGMSAMASNLLQQAKSLIQLPFTNSPTIHTAAGRQRQQQQTMTNEANREPRVAGQHLFRGRQSSSSAAAANHLRPNQEQLLGEATSPAPFSFIPAALTTNNNYHRQQLPFRMPPTWQQQMMMMPNHATQHNNNNQLQQRDRPKNPFGFNRYFLMPSSTMTLPVGHLRQHQQAAHHPFVQPPQPQQANAKNVPYFVNNEKQQQQQPEPPNHVGAAIDGGGQQQQQRPRVGENHNSVQANRENQAATGFQLAIEHQSTGGSGSGNSIGQLEQARKKFKSGLYQIEPPRLAAAGGQSRRQQQQVAAGDELQQTKEEPEDEQQSTVDDTDDDNEQPQQASSSSGAAEKQQQQQQQQPAATVAGGFAAKQVAASIGFSTNDNNSTTANKTHRGKVFNEPISDLIPKSVGREKTSQASPPSGPLSRGQNVASQTRQLKHSEEVTLYEFDSPAKPEEAPPQRAAVPVAVAPQFHHPQQQQQQQQLLETQVFTVPYTITMEPNGRPAHYAAAPSMRGNIRPNSNNFIHHREPPFAHSFISNTWAHPSAASAAAHGYFSSGQRAPLRYLAPPGVEPARQAQIFKSVFQDAQQLAAGSTAQQQRALDWTNQVASPALRSVSTLALLPQQQQQQQQHYFHYQPLPVQQQGRRPLQQSQQQQQVIYELANQLIVGQAQQQQQQQQFAVAIEHGADQSGGSVFTSNQQSVEQPAGNNREQQQAAATTQLPSTTTETAATTTKSPATTSPATAQPTESQRNEPTTSFASSAREEEEDDDDTTQKLANLRSVSISQQPPEQEQERPIRSASVFCANRAPGLYADEAQKCKAYYQCAPSGHQMFRCNNQTQFNQKSQNCDWWYNVNCAGQPLSSEAAEEQLPRSEPLTQRRRQSDTDTDSDSDDTDSRVDSIRGANEPQSKSALSSTLEQDPQQAQRQQQVSAQPQTTTTTTTATSTDGEHFHHALETSVTSSGSSKIAPSDQSPSASDSQQQQQQHQQEQEPAPTSSTPMYSSGLQASDFTTNQQEQRASEFSARSTTTQDPLLLLPSTTTTTPTTTTLAAAAATSEGRQQLESQPQVGSQLNDSPTEQQQATAPISSISSSTSISSTDSDDDGRAATVATPTNDTRATPKLAARSLTGGGFSSGSINGGGGNKRQRSSPHDHERSTVYSTSANQGSVSYTPMDTHELTARAFQQQADQGAASSGEQTSQKSRPLERRFGARLQQKPTTTMPINRIERGT